MERIYQLLLTAGYTGQGVEWLRRHGMATVVLLAIASWLVFIGIGLFVWSRLAKAT